MKWKTCLVPITVLLIIFINTNAQSTQNGRVEVVMPARAPEMPHHIPEIKKFTIYAISGKKKYKLKYTHLYESEADKLGYKARYERSLPPARYTLTIKGNEDYLLPSFLLGAGETYTINVPIARLPLSDYACFGGIFMFNRKEDADGKPVRAKIFETGGPSDISIHYCASEQHKEIITYKPACVYYKDYYLCAHEIQIDGIKRTITGVDSDLSNLFVLKNGGFIDATGKIFIFKF